MEEATTAAAVVVEVEEAVARAAPLARLAISEVRERLTHRHALKEKGTES
jgi:hypothetical protein